MNAWGATASAVILFIVALCAYALGRRIGYRQGMAVGMAFSPLEIRRQSLLQGRCLLCARMPVPDLEPSSRHDATANGGCPPEAEDDGYQQPTGAV